MVKITKKEFLGRQNVYDIGVVQDHNFLLPNGLVASNCFNKSHSTAYAYVTYQTAYLKANYPVEYMTALLTASSDNQDKIEKYRENCQKMGIEVLPPDINRSQKHFTPDDNKILFGFSAVKNLGEGAIDNILRAREEAGGKFTSLGDFCTRVDLRAVNRRALETLILCGAFDSIKQNRKQLMTDLELVINWAQTRAKEQASGQTNLFDFMASSEPENNLEFEQEPVAKKVEDFSLQEKLRLEKESLGFYVSEHPLKTIQKSASLFSPINLNQISECKVRSKVSAVAMITEIKKIMTKKGDPMAFLQLEDVSGQVEAIVFPSTYPKLEMILQEDIPLLVWGKVDKKDDQLQLIIEAMKPVEAIKLVMLELPIEVALDTNKHRDLRSIITEQADEKIVAKVPVVAVIRSETESRMIRFGQNFWVEDGEALVAALNSAGFSARASSIIN